MTSSKVMTTDIEELVGQSLNTINTNCENLNSRLTESRAANLDLLSDSTYGLAALNAAISKIPTSSSGGASLKNVTKTYSGVGGSSTPSLGLTSAQIAGLYAIECLSGNFSGGYSIKPSMHYVNNVNNLSLRLTMDYGGGEYGNVTLQVIMTNDTGYPYEGTYGTLFVNNSSTVVTSLKLKFYYWG